MSEILFDNGIWRIEAEGFLIHHQTNYAIDKPRLLNAGDNAYGSSKNLLDWPIHLAEKSWFDVEDFREPFKQAIETFYPDTDFCTIHFEESIRKAHVVAQEDYPERYAPGLRAYAEWRKRSKKRVQEDAIFDLQILQENLGAGIDPDRELLQLIMDQAKSWIERDMVSYDAIIAFVTAIGDHHDRAQLDTD